MVKRTVGHGRRVAAGAFALLAVAAIALGVVVSPAAASPATAETPSAVALQAAESWHMVPGVEGGRVRFDAETGTITAIESGVTSAQLPEAIDGVAVRAIGDWVGNYTLPNLDRLVLPATLERLGQGCFRGTQIRELSVPGSVELVPYCAFADNAALEAVTLGAGVREVGANCFERCESLVSLELPASLRAIGDYSFRGCSLLEDVTYAGAPFYPFDGEDAGLELGQLCFSGCFFGHPDFSDSYKSGAWYRALHDVRPTGDYLADVLAIARSQLGYHEGNSLAEMDGAHAGDGDYAEYCYWNNEPGQMWCGEFVGWCLAMASVPAEVVTPKYQTRNADGTTRAFTWQDTVYAGGDFALSPGDVILFTYTGGNHVVLVEDVRVEGGAVVVECLNGNHSDDVSRDAFAIDAATGKTIGVWTAAGGAVERIYSPDFSLAEGVPTCTVTFDANGGSAGWTEKRLTRDASYGLMPLPEREGYDFSGWYTQPEGGQKVSPYRRVRLSGDQVLYAHWELPGDGGAAAPADPTYASWGFDAETGTITRIPATWEGGRLPASIGGVPVVAVGDFAGARNRVIARLVVPGSVQRIGRGAFQGCTFLDTVVMEEGVREIGSYAFQGCHRLQHVRIPASMERIGGEYAYVFQACGWLEDVQFAGDPGAIEYGRGVFAGTLFLRPDFSDSYRQSAFFERLAGVAPSGDFLADALAVAASQDGYHEGDRFDEMGGGNAEGSDDFAEMAYFTSSPSYRWWPYEPEYSYGGWCMNFCTWALAMASVPEEMHGLWTLREDECPTWADTVYAGGEAGYVIKPGDVLNMELGHYCLVTDVSVDGDRVEIGTWNGNHNNNVCFDSDVFRASDGYNLSVAAEYEERGWGGDGGERYRVVRIFPALPERAGEVELFTVTFDGNGGSVEAGRQAKQIAASSFFGIMPVPVRDGYDFGGWYTQPEGGQLVTSYRKSRLEGDLTLFAHWSPREGDGPAPAPGEGDVPRSSPVEAFADVVPGSYFYDAVRWAVSANPRVTTGTSSTRFSPGVACTRAQAVTFLWRAAGCPDPGDAPCPFADAHESDYWYDAVRWAVASGITTGTSPATFDPQAPCTRAQVVTFLWRAAGCPDPGYAGNPFADVHPDDYCHDAVRWALASDITTGTSTEAFSPKRPCTRAHVVTFLWRAATGA